MGEYLHPLHGLYLGLFLLTSKPVLYVANIGEDDMADLESVNKRYARVEKVARTQKDKDSIAEF